ncbi:MAG: CarD family transcriptional regulator [Oscillospiraceae bacterium]|nr:CarD family transcriptional regulator [Oscillospiraceae bacterium]
MAVKTGDLVVYSGNEICRIDGIVKKCFDGVNELNYYRIVPDGSPASSYYIPEDKLCERVRPLLTREEILDVIDRMPDAEITWSDDRNERKQMFGQVLRSDDYRQLLGMMKALHLEKEKRGSSGKRLISSDEKAFEAAHRLMHKEFSHVLGIPEEKIPEFIENRLRG